MRERRELTIQRLVEAASSQVVSDDDISNGVKDKLYIVGVCGTRLMAVNFLRCAFVFRFELSLDVRRSFLVTLFACNRRQQHSL